MEPSGVAQGVSSVETPVSLVYPRRGRRHAGSASIAWLISLLLHGALFAGLWQMVYSETLPPRRIIIPEARLAPSEATAGELTPSNSPLRSPEPAGTPPLKLDAPMDLPASEWPTPPPLPDALPVIAAPAGEPAGLSSSFVSAVVSPAPAAGAGSGSARSGTGGGGPAALAGVGPVTGFFGQGGNAYKVVYVVDASASLSYYMNDVVEQMRKSIRDLVPTQSFHIIVTYNREVREFSPRRLVPANAQYKREASTFLGTITSGGKADPIEAMRRAFAVRPELIYFLSDGDYRDIQEELERTLVQLNADGGVAITTIGFDPSPAPTELLKRIAQRHHGHFRLVQFTN